MAGERLVDFGFKSKKRICDYEYHLKDHLGNTRVTFTTKPKTIDISLNYESSTVDADDEAMFSDLNNIIAADIHDYESVSESLNHDKVQLLNGAEGGVIGSVLTIPVGKGDKINASVYAKYMTPKGTANATAAVGKLLMTAISGSTGLGTYEGTVTGNYGGSGSMVTNLYSDELSDTEPYAFINLAFLSEDVTATPIISYGQIKEASANGMAQITLPEIFEAPENGYVIVYLSNESEYLTEVYFDDLEIEVEEHPVIQKDDYYPFGLTFNRWQRNATARENRFKFNGFEEQTDLGWNVYDYLARYYNPAIGRFLNVDPAAEMMRRHSPYNYAFDNPIRFIDPDGMVPEEVGKGPCGDKPCPDEGGTFADGVQKGMDKLDASLTQLFEDPNGTIDGALKSFLNDPAKSIDNAIESTKESIEAAGDSDEAAGELFFNIILAIATEGIASEFKFVDEVVGGADDILQGGKRLPNDRLKNSPNKRGNAPIGDDGYPVELHHRNQTMDSPIDEMTRADHRGGNNYKKNHSNTGQSGSNINRKTFSQQRRNHWENEWDSGRFNSIGPFEIE
ncbi:MAG: RHS repeat-associated core domain-containing protein [Fulvivirga sp.]